MAASAPASGSSDSDCDSNCGNTTDILDLFDDDKAESFSGFEPEECVDENNNKSKKVKSKVVQHVVHSQPVVGKGPGSNRKGKAKATSKRKVIDINEPSTSSGITRPKKQKLNSQ